MIVNHSFFVGALHIANTDRVDVQEQITLAVEQYEPEFLQDALGYSLGSTFIAALAANSTDERYTSLRDGATYFDAYGIMRKWKGFKQSGTLAPVSPIAAYVYFHFMRNAATVTTGLGEISPGQDNGSKASPLWKLVQAWRQVSDAVRELVLFLDAHPATYPEWNYLVKAHALRTFRPINMFGI